MLFLFKSTLENKKRKHSEHFLHHQEPIGSQRADRTYCTCITWKAFHAQITIWRVTKEERKYPSKNVKLPLEYFFFDFKNLLQQCVVVHFWPKNRPQALEGILPVVSKSCSDSGKQANWPFGIHLLIKKAQRRSYKDQVYVPDICTFPYNFCITSQQW